MTIKEQFNQLTQKDKDLLKSFGKVINYYQNHNDSEMVLVLEIELNKLESSLFKTNGTMGDRKELTKLINSFIGID